MTGGARLGPPCSCHYVNQIDMETGEKSFFTLTYGEDDGPTGSNVQPACRRPTLFSCAVRTGRGADALRGCLAQPAWYWRPVSSLICPLLCVRRW
eukprot:2833632-Rhodomonas_salina.2